MRTLQVLFPLPLRDELLTRQDHSLTPPDVYGVMMTGHPADAVVTQVRAMLVRPVPTLGRSGRAVMATTRVSQLCSRFNFGHAFSARESRATGLLP